jgi:hypothetical protein
LNRDVHRDIPRSLAAALAFSIVLCASGCAVPLAPGYHIETETVELSFVDQPKPLLHLRGRYRLENIGNVPLTSLDLIVPEKDFLGRQNLRVTVNGKEARITERLPDEHLIKTAQIAFEPAWRPHEKREIEIACDMSAGIGSSTIMARDAFVFDGAYWFPTFETPKHLFAKGEQRANPTDLSLVLPKDFLAVASGQQTGQKTHGETVEYRFRQRAQDGAAFVVAGRYKQQVAKSKGTVVHFLTFQGLPDDAVRSAGDEIAAAAQFFDSDFVARARGASPVWVTEIPENQIFNMSDSKASPMQSFPNMILLNKDNLHENIGGGRVSGSELALLADTWVRWMSSPKDNEPMLQDTLGAYMADAFNESRERAPYRQTKIAEYLRQYDQSHPRAEEIPIVQITSNGWKNDDQLNMALNKARLFLYALEDACKPEVFRRSVGSMLSNLRGSEYGYEDLRAAVSIECGRTAETDALFRRWLYENGIPAGFRERYSVSAAAQDSK